MLAALYSVRCWRRRDSVQWPESYSQAAPELLWPIWLSNRVDNVNEPIGEVFGTADNVTRESEGRSRAALCLHAETRACDQPGKWRQVLWQLTIAGTRFRGLFRALPARKIRLDAVARPADRLPRKAGLHRSRLSGLQAGADGIGPGSIGGRC